MSDATVRVLRRWTHELSQPELEALRSLAFEAFAADGDGLAETDWTNSLGGTHIIVERGGTFVSHAAVVPRTLWVDGHELQAGYVEAVATRPGLQGQGFGSRVMEATAGHIRERFQIGALSTGRPSFYERLGWRTWTGPTLVNVDGKPVATPDDDGGILVLVTPRTPTIDLGGPIVCDWREGDVW